MNFDGFQDHCPSCCSFSANEEKGDITVIPREMIENIFEFLSLEEVLELCNKRILRRLPCDKNFWIYTAQRLNLPIEEILIKAIRRNYIGVIDSLLQIDDIIINYQEREEPWNSVLLVAAQIGNIEVVDRLLEMRGINVNLRNRKGTTPLIAAALEGNIEVVNRLLQNSKIDVNLQEKNGRSALMLAAAFGHFEVVESLLQEDTINVNLQNYNGDTALM